MGDKVRFHFDEHVPFLIAQALRRRGIDVTTTQELGLRGVDDHAQLSHAASGKRVMVTADADYLRLHASGVAHYGIAFWRQASCGRRELIRGLVLIHDVLDVDDMRQRLEYL